jgi:hypothetical protein
MKNRTGSDNKTDNEDKSDNRNKMTRKIETIDGGLSYHAPGLLYRLFVLAILLDNRRP